MTAGNGKNCTINPTWLISYWVWAPRGFFDMYLEMTHVPTDFFYISVKCAIGAALLKCYRGALSSHFATPMHRTCQIMRLGVFENF